MATEYKEPTTWRAYSKDMTEAEIRAAFAVRYGKEPATVKMAGSVWLAGPLDPKLCGQVEDLRD